MFKPCVLVCHPKDIVYPIWMYRMNKDRDLFNRIIVVMTQSGSDRNYTDYIKRTIKDVTMVFNYKDDGSDWRNAAINEGLYEVRSDKVLFLEQDFLVVDGFFKALFEKAESYTTVGFRDGNRFHPACLLTTMDALAYTKKDFSVDKDKGDHFSKVTKELEKLDNWASLKNFDLPEYHHLAGLTQNYRLDKNFYNAKEFFTYLLYSTTVPQPIDWQKFSEEVKSLVIADRGGDMTYDDSFKVFFE